MIKNNLESDSEGLDDHRRPKLLNYRKAVGPLIHENGRSGTGIGTCVKGRYVEFVICNFYNFFDLKFSQYLRIS